MADKTSAATYGQDAPTVDSVTTAGTTPTDGAQVLFDDASVSVETSAAIERAKIQFLDYLADKA